MLHRFFLNSTYFSFATFLALSSAKAIIPKPFELPARFLGDDILVNASATSYVLDLSNLPSFI